MLSNKDANFFSSETAIQDVPEAVEAEPELFNDNDVSIFRDEKESEEAATPVVEEAPASKPTSFIDRFIGISLARKRNVEEPAKREVKFDEEPMQKTGTDDIEFSEDDLDIPSFLRRK